jgi:sugar lactone lactonase YvrE
MRADLSICKKEQRQMKILHFDHYVLIISAAATTLAGCGGSSAPIGAPGAIPQSVAALGHVDRGADLGRLASRATRVYFAWGYNPTQKSIRAYAATANGNLPATVWIAGNKTQLEAPATVYMAPFGALYSCDFVDGRILAFAPGAHGNVAPIRNIGGSNNPVTSCRGVALYDGRVAAVGGDPKNSAVVWNKGLDGNAKPTTIISGAATKLNSPGDVAFDGSGNLYVANANDAITVYAPNAGGNAAPLRTIAGKMTGLSLPGGLGIDRARGLIYVANLSGNAITAYKLSQSGNVKPTVAISGAKTGLDAPGGVAVDAAGYIYVSNHSFSRDRSLVVYKPGSNGNVAPVQIVKGDKVSLGGHIAVR